MFVVRLSPMVTRPNAAHTVSIKLPITALRNDCRRKSWQGRWLIGSPNAEVMANLGFVSQIGSENKLKPRWVSRTFVDVPGQVRCGRHTPEQRVAASTLRRYSFGLRLAIAQADARPPCRIVLFYSSKMKTSLKSSKSKWLVEWKLRSIGERGRNPDARCV